MYRPTEYQHLIYFISFIIGALVLPETIKITSDILSNVLVIFVKLLTPLVPFIAIIILIVAISKL